MDCLAGKAQLHSHLRPAHLLFLHALCSAAGAVLQPWDQEFYTRQLSSSKPHVKATTAAAPYLQLGSILTGLSQLLQQLMGLHLELQPLQPGEGWAHGVLKLLVTCQDSGPLGVLYLDLLARPGKPGASGILYPLRCGRQLSGVGADADGLCAACIYTRPCNSRCVLAMLPWCAKLRRAGWCLKLR
jgi:Zn-dependent oligopeptidase